MIFLAARECGTEACFNKFLLHTDEGVCRQGVSEPVGAMFVRPHR